VRFDLGEQFLLERQIFEHGLDDVVGLAHRGGEIGRRPHALDGGGVVAEILEIGQDARLGAVEVR